MVRNFLRNNKIGLGATVGSTLLGVILLAAGATGGGVLFLLGGVVGAGYLAYKHIRI